MKYLIFKVRAIRKWKNDFVIIVEAETGELFLAIEDKIKFQVKTEEEVIGEIIDGIVHLNDFVSV